MSKFKIIFSRDQLLVPSTFSGHLIVPEGHGNWGPNKTYFDTRHPDRQYSEPSVNAKVVKLMVYAPHVKQQWIKANGGLYELQDKIVWSWSNVQSIYCSINKTKYTNGVIYDPDGKLEPLYISKDKVLNNMFLKLVKQKIIDYEPEL